MAKFTAAAPERVQRAAGSHPRVSGEIFGFISAPFSSKIEHISTFTTTSAMTLHKNKEKDRRTPPAVFRVCYGQMGSDFITNLSQTIKYCADPKYVMYVSSESETNALLMTSQQR